MFRKGGATKFLTWAAMFALWVVLLAAWAIQLGLRPAESHEEQPKAASFFSKLDPPIGYRVNLPDKDVFGSPIRKEDSEVVDVLLITAGTCNSCAKNKIHPEELAAENFSQVILVFRSSEREVREHFGKGRRDLRYVADPDGAITRGLNAYFTPRFYALDRSHTLRKLQSAPMEKLFEDRALFQLSKGDNKNAK